MGRKYLSVSKKLDVVPAAELSGNVLGTARVNNVHPIKFGSGVGTTKNLLKKTKKL